MADTPGFVANRLQFALYNEAARIVEEGVAKPEQIDTVVSNTFGFRLALFGPFAIGDMAGLDVSGTIDGVDSGVAVIGRDRGGDLFSVSFDELHRTTVLGPGFAQELGCCGRSTALQFIAR